MSNKVYFKYHSGSKCFFQCHEVNGEMKLFKPYIRLDECFVSDVILTFDEDEYKDITSEYQQEIEKWDTTKEIRKNSKDGYILYVDDYGTTKKMETDKYIIKRFIKYRKFNKAPFKVLNCKMK